MDKKFKCRKCNDPLVEKCKQQCDVEVEEVEIDTDQEPVDDPEAE